MSSWMLDAGHGDKDPGAVGANGTKEKDVALKLVKKIGASLEAAGEQVFYTRQTDIFISLSDRAKLANDKKVDYFISIHINSFRDPQSNGTETYTYVYPDQQATKLARLIQQELVGAIGLRDRGVKIANFAVLRETKMTAALVEVAFISNLEEEKLLRDEAFLEKAAIGISKGLLKHIGKEVSKMENKKPHWGQAAVDDMKKAGLITSDKDPAAQVTWAEFATVINRLNKINVEIENLKG